MVARVTPFHTVGCVLDRVVLYSMCYMYVLLFLAPVTQLVPRHVHLMVMVKVQENTGKHARPTKT